MTRRSDAETIQEVTARIDLAIRENRRQERLIEIVLVLLLGVGVGLIVYGAVRSSWLLLAPGGLLQLSIAFPIRWLIKLRADNLRLQILPQLLRMADTEEARALAGKLALRLIEQV